MNERDKEPNLWVQALTYFAGKEEDCHREITEVLANIDHANLLPPLLVVQILAAKQSATLSVIKEYIMRRLSQENQLIAEVRIFLVCSDFSCKAKYFFFLIKG